MKDLIEAMIRRKLEDSVAKKDVRVTKIFLGPDFNPAIERVKKHKVNEGKNKNEDNAIMDKDVKKNDDYKVNYEVPDYKLHDESVYKENHAEKGKVYAAFVCDFIFINRTDENEFVQEAEFLGLYSDPEKAEKVCNEYGHKNFVQWKPITALNFIPWYDNHKMFYKLKSEYLFSTDYTYFSLTIRNRVVMEVEIDKFITSDLTYANFMSQDTYEKILDAFRWFRYEHENNVSKLESTIHKLLEAED